MIVKCLLYCSSKTSKKITLQNITMAGIICLRVVAEFKIVDAKSVKDPIINVHQSETVARCHLDFFLDEIRIKIARIPHSF